jgi:hypothetical protein
MAHSLAERLEVANSQQGTRNLAMSRKYVLDMRQPHAAIFDEQPNRSCNPTEPSIEPNARWKTFLLVQQQGRYIRPLEPKQCGGLGLGEPAP